MKRTVENWSIEELQKYRDIIDFPEYQRQPKLWSQERKERLIDSILGNIDIPKLYFNQTKDGEYEVVDGQQRLWAIWEFLEDEYPYNKGGKARTYSKLTPGEQRKIRDFILQVTVLQDADDDYLRELFLRLQLGLLLVTGEKLHAATGAMKQFVFDVLVKRPFVAHVNIPSRRYAKETLCAQISINSFMKAKTAKFARTRYEDLIYFFKEYENPRGQVAEFYARQTKHIEKVLKELDDAFKEKATSLSNRSYILSIYLLFEELREDLGTPAARKQFVDFIFLLWRRLREEISEGFDRRNRELYTFETMVSSAPGEKYQIERRHTKLLELFEYFKATKTIRGDK
jgi:uncharacterized protein with ParB-like and HNH nuclease domain